MGRWRLLANRCDEDNSFVDVNGKRDERCKREREWKRAKSLYSALPKTLPLAERSLDLSSNTALKELILSFRVTPFLLLHITSNHHKQQQ
jgi:hypothetical protein